MATIRTPAGQRIFPLWNTQGLADAISAATGALNFGTYLGHSPTAERAVDCFTTIPLPRSNRVLGDAIAEYVLNARISIVDPDGNERSVSAWEYFAVRYIIWRQRINWNDGEGWIAMENRGDDTQNHFDHDHISLNVIPRPSTIPGPRGPISTIAGGNEVIIVNVKDTGIFLLRGSEVTHLQAPAHVLEWVGVGVPYQDRKEMSRDVFSAYTGWGQAQGLLGGAGLAQGDDTEAADQAAREYQALLEQVQAGIDETYNEYIREMTAAN